jgi:hypothetical protein
VLSLPLGPHLAEEQASHVIREINRFLSASEEPVDIRIACLGLD